MSNGISRRASRRIVAAGAVTVAAVLAGLHGSPVSAETIEVEVATQVYSGAAGSTVTLGSTSVPAALKGQSCNLAVEIINQESVHSGNSISVSSGSSSVKIDMVEEEANATVKGGGVLTLDGTVEIKLTFGADGTSSIGSNLKVTCETLPPAPPPTAVKKTPKFTG
ncbi:MAG: hypothetical protein OEY70_17595 [Acidimicrobiia bacterium]|nr:hypothetical protein [Acidimicrobiia bacterium]